MEFCLPALKLIRKEITMEQKEEKENQKPRVVIDTESSLTNFIQSAKENKNTEQTIPVTSIAKPPTAEEYKAKCEAQKRMEVAAQRANEKATTSRANEDVAMAMMLSAQLAEGSSSQTPTYVVHGAKMCCSFGSREARLVVPLDHGVLTSGNPQMVVEDNQSLSNVMCFGNCFSSDNPLMEQEAIKMTNEYNEEKTKKSFFTKFKSIFGIETKAKKVDSVSEELKEAMICECIPKIVEIWSDGSEKTVIDEKHILLHTSTLVCEYGGVITIIDNGQNK